MSRLNWLTQVLFDHRLVTWSPSTQELCARLMRNLHAPDRPPLDSWN